jgi:SAM-dependent methyltransferase
MNRRSLHQIFLSNGDNTIHKWLHYFDIYERHFARFVDRAPSILEIGVAGGGSLRMWREYFGPGAKIVGLDVNPACRQHAADGIEVFIGSQDDPAVLDEIAGKYEFDIVIDDGSHMMDHLNFTFTHLYDRVKPHGVYLAEDLHTCYWPRFGGGLRRQKSFLERVKGLVDELNAVHTRGALPPTRFTATTASITIYDSIVVFEKAPQGTRQMVKTQRMEVP